jgi:hypothetical protein
MQLIMAHILVAQILVSATPIQEHNQGQAGQAHTEKGVMFMMQSIAPAWLTYKLAQVGGMPGMLGPAENLGVKVA